MPTSHDIFRSDIGAGHGSPDVDPRPMTGLLDAVSGAPPLTRVLPDVATALAQAAGMRRATVLLFDRRGDLAAGTSRTSDASLDSKMWAAFRLLHVSMPAIDAARRGAAVAVFLNPETATALGPGDWVSRFEARTVVVAPIRTRRRVLGVAVIDDPGRGGVDERAMAGLDAALSAAGAVLELLEAVETERRARARSEQVLETAAATARSLSATAALKTVTSGLQLLTGDVVVVASAATDAEPKVEWSGDAAGARAAADAFERGGATAELAGVEALDLESERWAPLAALGFSRVLAVPLRHLDREVGWVLSLGVGRRRYAEDDRRAAVVLGEQASLALHTTSLLEAERAAVDRLTELDRLKNTFVAAVSHELRTPLTAILGFSELLAEEIDDPALAGHIADLRHESAVLEALIGNLLDTSRLEAGLLRLNVHPVDVAATITQAIEVVRHAQPHREVRFHAPERLRPIPADGVRLRQVFINLIENAAKYSAEGTPIDVTVWPDVPPGPGGWLEVTVDDRGPGIPEEERLRVFERFRRLDGHRQSPGTGIGLYVVKALVEAHGGTITIENGPDGAGSRFRVRLPMGSSDA